MRAKSTERTYCTIFSYFSRICDQKGVNTVLPSFTNLKQSGSKGVARLFSPFSQITDQKRSERHARFFAILTNLRPEKSEPLAQLLAVLSNLWPERSEICARFLAILANLRAKRHEFIPRFLVVYTKFD